MSHTMQITTLYTELLRLLSFGNGPKGIAIASACLTVGVVFSVLAIGAIMNGIERLQISLLRKIFGLKAALFICNYLTIAGTILHECAHALFGFCTGARITEISFYDRKGDSLGHISYIPRGPFFTRAIQHTMIACAPVFAGLITGYVLLNGIFQDEQSIGFLIFRWYLVISIVDHMSMSSIDRRHYFQGMWIVAPLIFGIFFAFGYFFV